MTIWVPNLSTYTGPRYLALVTALQSAITRKELLSGTKLPPVRDLAYELKMTPGTVARAYQVAAARGLIVSEVGRGTYVQSVDCLDDPLVVPSVDRTDLAGSTLIEMTQNVPVSGIGAKVIAGALRRVAAQADMEPAFAGSLVGYSTKAEDERCRKIGVEWFRRSRLEVDPQLVIPALGSQNAFVLALKALTKPDERVLCESLVYPAFQTAARFLGLTLQNVLCDEDGMNPDALSHAVQMYGARVVFLVPTLHNPTTITMSEKRRRAIADLARRYDLLIVEDDVYGQLLPEPLLPLKALVPERVLYISSVSKCFMPGMRAAWIAAPPQFVGSLAKNLYAMMIAPPTLPFAIVGQLIRDGNAERLIAAQRNEISARIAMTQAAFTHGELTTKPYCSHALVELPPVWSAAEFVAAARERGVALVPAEVFAVGENPIPKGIRLCLGQPQRRSDLQHALEILAALVHQAPEAAALVI